MIITYIHRIGWFIGLVLLQVLILNSVHIAGYATPFLYIYFILKFSSGTSRNELMLWAFFFGLTIDIFSDTPGMNAAATVLLAFLRPSLLRLFMPRDNPDSLIPSFKTMGISPFLKYTTASVFCTVWHYSPLSSSHLPAFGCYCCECFFALFCL